MITLSFMVVGHTKFTADSCFGLLKQRFRRTHVQCLDDLVKVVEESADVNKAKLIGNEAGDVFVPTYDWLSFFAPDMKKLPQIKLFHQFTFSSLKPGIVTCKEYSDSSSIDIDVRKNKLTWHPVVTDLPPVITPKGLSADRQWYLYEKIRPYCQEYSADITCPLPSVSRPTMSNTPTTSPVRTSSSARLNHHSSTIDLIFTSFYSCKSTHYGSHWIYTPLTFSNTVLLYPDSLCP